MQTTANHVSGAPDRRRPRPWLLLSSLALTAVAVAAVGRVVDPTALRRGLDSMLGDPAGALLAVAAFAAAFALRTVAWRLVLPDLSLGHAWSALHVALGGNHLLPLRLGEPLRVVSVVRRARIGWQRAAASAVTLRAADVTAIASLGLLSGLDRLGDGGLAALAIVVGGVVVAVAGGWWLRRSEGEARLPGPLALTATVSAWALEAVVVWKAAAWVGVHLTPGEAMLVTAAAVVAQVAAFAPGGFGTYEAGGTTVLVALGHDPGLALAAVLTAHALKTAYSLLTGGLALFAPAPGLMGRFRLPRSSPDPPPIHRSTARPRPVVIFLPAHDEEASVARVVARAPAEVRGHPVLVLVIDDGSRDQTAVRAREAGARVVKVEENRGLGAAVRIGLREALAAEPAAVAFCDADGEYDPAELERLVGPILDGQADYVVGSRFAGEIRRMLPHRKLGNKALTLALSWVARRRIGDGQSGYRAFSPEAAAAAEVIHDFNYAQVLTLDLLAKGFRYREVPISYGFRTTGRSFVRLGPYLRKVVPAVWRELNTA